MQARLHHHQAGFSLAELLMGVLVFVTAAMVLGNHVTINYSSTQQQRDKVFAFTKAQALLSEIHTFVDSGNVEDHPLSGNLSRNSQWQWSRRITVRPFASINNRTVRYVTARIFKRDGAGVEQEMASLSSVVNSLGSAFPATQVFDVYLLAIENIPGWWVYMEAIIPFVESAITDLENRNPGLSMRTHWITKSGYGRNMAYRPYTNDVDDSVQHMPEVYFYPGKMPAGSASTYYYVPDLFKSRIMIDGVENNGYDATLNPYPYALADFFNHNMRYPRAKAFHDARMLEVQNRKAAIQAAEIAGMAPPPELDDMSEEPTWRLLLEDMNTNPAQYRHALLVNLHGELLPMPSLRNYSDAAKDPINLPHVRVVTHPEELRTERPRDGSEPPLPFGADTSAVFRVYAYTNNMAWTNSGIVPNPSGVAGHEGRMPLQKPIALQFMDVNLTDEDTPVGATDLDHGVTLEALVGGVGGLNYQPFNNATTTPDAHRMWYQAMFVDPGPGEQKYTLIVLYNTPIIAPRLDNGADTPGLWNNLRSRLYNLEYNPGPCQGNDFDPSAVDPSLDLFSNGDGPKNTARWRITIPEDIWKEQRFVDQATPPNYFDPRDTSERDRVLTVRTRIWDPAPLDQNGNTAFWVETGTMPGGTETRIVQPDNLSETYTWWADSANDVPMTERAQFQGDPRHNPYQDLLSGDPDFPEGYNWFHDSLTYNAQNALADFPGIVRAYDRWGFAMRQDVPRFFELLRNGLVNSRAIWTTLTGYSYYYMGHGNEIGYDSANGYPSSIPVSLFPWGYGPGSTGTRNNITWYRTYIRQAVGGGQYWWGKPWLGELYPDWIYASDFGSVSGDMVRGNLRAGNISSTFWRYQDYASHYFTDNKAWGTAMFPGIQRTSTAGTVSMFNNGTTAGHFNHHFADGQTGDLVGSGQDLSDNYGFPLPGTTDISRPFSVNTTGNLPFEFSLPPYSTNRFTANIARTFYDHQTGYTGSGLVELLNTAASDSAYVVVNGIAQTTTTGSSFIAKYCLLTLFQSFFEAGDAGMTFRIQQPVRVEITGPTEITELLDPTTIDIQFQTSWLRWDNQPYTSSTPVGFTENEAEIDYVVMYSRDVGETWQYMQDDSPAEIGLRPTNPAYLVADTGVGDETFVWPVPALNFPEGSYLIRVEAYRQNQALHYSQHMTKIYIER
ncbi:MAG: type IV pilus modification PilV family protein [Planctomycetota bacterium]|jgi:hypothetical protein